MIVGGQTENSCSIVDRLEAVTYILGSNLMLTRSYFGVMVPFLIGREAYSTLFTTL